MNYNKVIFGINSILFIEKKGLKTMIAEKIIESLLKSESRAKRPKLSPSELGNVVCVRKMVMDRSPFYVNKAIPSDLKQQAVFLMGNAVHEYFQNHVLTNIPGMKVVGVEKWIENDFLNGKIDVIMKVELNNDQTANEENVSKIVSDKNSDSSISFADEFLFESEIHENVANVNENEGETESDDGEKILVELKTASAAKFLLMKENGPLHEHIEQLQSYLGEEKVEKGYIIVINKDFCSSDLIGETIRGEFVSNDDFILEFEVIADSNIFEGIKKFGETMVPLFQKAKENNEIPEKIERFSPNRFPCMWCRHKFTCWEKAYKETDFKNLPAAVKTDIGDLIKERENIKNLLKKYSKALLDNDKQMKRIFYGLGNYSIIKGKNKKLIFDGKIRIESLDQEEKNIPLIDPEEIITDIEE